MGTDFVQKLLLQSAEKIQKEINSSKEVAKSVVSNKRLSDDTSNVSPKKIKRDKSWLNEESRYITKSEEVKNQNNFVMDLLLKSAEKLNNRKEEAEVKHEQSSIGDIKIKDSRELKEKGVKKEYFEVKPDPVRTEKIEVEYYEEHKFLEVKRECEEEECSSRLKSNLPNQKSNTKVIQRKHTDTTNKIASRKRVGGNRQFLPSEDKIVLEAIKQFGDRIDTHKLARELKRPHGTVHARVKLLKSGRSLGKKKRFTFVEDCKILDKILIKLKKNLTEKIVKEDLDPKDCEELGVNLDRNHRSIFHRWTEILRPWLNQFFLGTLGLDIRVGLANFLADNFVSRSEVDWERVAMEKEFAGNDPKKLMAVFSEIIERSVRRRRPYYDISRNEITLKQIQVFANDKLKSKREIKSVKQRQMDIIDYFTKNRREPKNENFEEETIVKEELMKNIKSKKKKKKKDRSSRSKTRHKVHGSSQTPFLLTEDLILLSRVK